jgi:8-oxo-dGTP diphosphatase
MPRLLLVAACALVDADGRVLIAQRPEGKSMAGLWEFPGERSSRVKRRKTR